ncbi:ankyrin repeat domain-containing protein [Wolbachia endosymbiont of Cylisticus convexus]|nr:ankyrin repeat domain-containing protein [Wolbachia endosymbiont of Cylisticus convexus]
MLNMSKKQATLWFILVIVCVVITYYYQKSKAAEEYQKMLEMSAKNCDLETVKSLVKKVEMIQVLAKRHYIMLQRKDA